MQYLPSFSRSTLGRRLGIGLGAAALAVCLAGCQSGRISNQISTTQEHDLGNEYAQQIDTQAKFVTDGAYLRHIQSLAQPIFAQAVKDRPGESFRIRVIDSPELNAFSIPGGYIYMYRGLVDKFADDDDALACIIAHESAHVTRRHVVKQMSDAQGKGMLVDLATILTRSYAVQQIGGTLYQMDQLHYSRGAEYEADRWGEKFAYNAGFDPSGMVRTMTLFEKLDKGQAMPPAYALDHPVSHNRALRAIEQYRELRANGGQYVSEAYQVGGDKIAARQHDISYPALVLATMAPVLPQQTKEDRAEDKATAKSAAQSAPTNPASMPPAAPAPRPASAPAAPAPRPASAPVAPAPRPASVPVTPPAARQPQASAPPTS